MSETLKTQYCSFAGTEVNRHLLKSTMLQFFVVGVGIGDFFFLGFTELF